MAALKRIFAFLLCFSLLAPSVWSGSVDAEQSSANVEETVTVSAVNGEEKNDYEGYLVAFADKNGLAADGDPTEFFAESNLDVEEHKVRLIDSEYPYTLSFEVAKDGWYNIGLRYIPHGECERLILDVKIDGITPFSELENTELYTAWVDNGEITEDKKGNNVRPEQIEAKSVAEQLLRDNSSAYNEAYSFFITAGIHTLDIAMKKGELALCSAVISPA